MKEIKIGDLDPSVEIITLNKKDYDELESQLKEANARIEELNKDPVGKLLIDNCSEIKRLSSENARLRECVEFYADRNNRGGSYPWQTMTSDDLEMVNKKNLCGKRARQCLASLGDGEKE